MKKMKKAGLAITLFCIILPSMECRPSNHLANEKSPYLLQHAYNPVDWYPWGEEAFQKAQKENKPIFLSIGYSTCHWCHVMERESFENKKIAELLNKNFVNIKVDREERPDIDHEYMQVCQLLSPSCGWPLTIIMTPNREPFFAATYLPPTDRRGMRGLSGLLPEVYGAYHKQPDKIQTLVLELRRLLAKPPQKAHLNPEQLFQKAFTELKNRYDFVHGGFGTAPKFPSPHTISFLLHYGWQKSRHNSTQQKEQAKEALSMAFETLKKIRLSGTYDQLGFGFHRYATDSAWRVPHFEKMLYDQAMLLLAYTDAIRVLSLSERTNQKTLQDPFGLSEKDRNKYIELFCQSIDETVKYLVETMHAPKGGFYTAEDADSDGKEGTFYIWDYKEVATLPDAEFLLQAFGLKKHGVSHELSGKNTLIYPQDWPKLARAFGISEREAFSRFERGRRLLYEKRKERNRPFLDKKILTDMNGLLIAALSRAALVRQNKEYAKLAKEAADFLLSNMRRKGTPAATALGNGSQTQKNNHKQTLLHRYYEGEVGIPALLDDYSFFVFGLTELYMATSEVRYLREALHFQQEMIDNFYDTKAGGFFHSPKSQTPAFVATKPLYDGAIPSGNSMALYNLVRLTRIADKSKWEELTEKSISTFSADLTRQPSAFSQLLLGLLLENGGKEIVIAFPKKLAPSSSPLSLFSTKSPEKASYTLSEDSFAETNAIFKLICQTPETLLLYHSPELTELLAFTKGQGPQQGKTTIYVCQNRVCRYPVNTIRELKKALEEN